MPRQWDAFYLLNASWLLRLRFCSISLPREDDNGVGGRGSPSGHRQLTCQRPRRTQRRRLVVRLHPSAPARRWGRRRCGTAGAASARYSWARTLTDSGCPGRRLSPRAGTSSASPRRVGVATSTTRALTDHVTLSFVAVVWSLRCAATRYVCIIDTPLWTAGG